MDTPKVKAVRADGTAEVAAPDDPHEKFWMKLIAN